MLRAEPTGSRNATGVVIDVAGSQAAVGNSIRLRSGITGTTASSSKSSLQHNLYLNSDRLLPGGRGPIDLYASLTSLF
jgi:hypothetical protein